MAGTAGTGQTKLDVYLDKLRKKESVDGIPPKLLGYEDSEVLTLLYSFGKTVEDGRVDETFFDSTINDIKKSEEEPYERAKKMKSAAAVDHHVCDHLTAIGLFPIQLQDSQPCFKGMLARQFKEQATAYTNLGVEFHEFVEALSWTYDEATIQECADKNVLPESLLTEDCLEVYRVITKVRIGNLLLDVDNLKLWNNKESARRRP